jgi:hypothetical protein
MGDDTNNGPNEGRAARQNEGGARAVTDVHLAKAISHLTLALEALDRADVALACGYVDLALTICMDARVERQRPKR